MSEPVEGELEAALARMLSALEQVNLDGISDYDRPGNAWSSR